jgi:hypothetical protein
MKIFQSKSRLRKWKKGIISKRKCQLTKFRIIIRIYIMLGENEMSSKVRKSVIFFRKIKQ